MLTDSQSRARPDRLDHTRALVTEDARTGRRRGAINRVLIGVADATPSEANACLLRSGVSEVELMDLKGLARGRKYRSADFHIVLFMPRVERGSVDALEHAQFVDWNVTPHHMSVGNLRERRFRRLTRALDGARTAGVEHTASRKIDRRRQLAR